MPTVKSILERVQSERRIEREPTPPHCVAAPPPIPQLLQQDLLEWYLGQGQSLFERSPTGAVLELVAMRAYSSVQCRACHGSGISGYQPGKEPVRVFNLDRLRVLWEKNEKRPIRSAIERALQDCPECDGTGAKSVRESRAEQRYSKHAPFAPLETPDARPRASAQFSLKSAPDDGSLTRYATVSRRLAALPRALQRVLVAAYGNDGQSWSDVEERGRLWAVVPLTITGAALLKSDPGLVPSNHGSCRLDDIAKLNQLRPAAQQSSVLGNAIREAATLLGRAIAAWNAVVNAEVEN